MSLGPSQLISFNHIQFPSFIFEKKDSNPSLLFVEEAKPITSSFHYLTQPKERKDQPSRREQQELKEEKSINGAAFSWMNALSSIWLISFLPRPSIQSTNEKSFLCWWMKGGKAASFLQLNGNEIEGSWVLLSLFVEEVGYGPPAIPRTKQLPSFIIELKKCKEIQCFINKRLRLACLRWGNWIMEQQGWSEIHS